MKILWIVNILFPEAVKLLGGKDDFNSSGGWLLASAATLIKSEVIKLYVLSVSDKVETFKILEGKKITYCIIPRCRRMEDYKSYMSQVKEVLCPDIIHIHGTELPFGMAWVSACSSNNVVVSIQGLISVIARYYFANLKWWEIMLNITFRDMLCGTIWSDQRDFKQRGNCEIEVIKKVRHIIGRTSFDRAHCEAINPIVQYHFCNETLRPEFYESPRWDYTRCKQHTIFLSQASYPIKALHQVLKALPIVLKKYHNVQVYIAGRDITCDKTLSDKLRRSGYGKIIKRLIKVNNLESCVHFIGALNAEQMIHEYLSANLFICPSCIENSSNSLAEAQILGVPCLASYVGGLMDMIPNSDCGELYRFEEVEMLAWKICNWFERSAKFDNKNMVNMARQRHDSKINNQNLINIYYNIYNKMNIQ